MTLTLVDAPPGTVEQHPSGLIVLRAADYMGPARAGLSSVADATSVSGTVVLEEQAFAVPTTLAGAGSGTVSIRWALASDTLRIPVSTISPFLTGFTRIHAYASLKVLGDVPSNARYKKAHCLFNQDAGGAQAGMSWGRDTSVRDDPGTIPTSLYGDQYKLQQSLLIVSDITGGTDLTLRAWGVTGGTMQFYIDLVYLMPWDRADNLSLVHFGGSYMPFQLASNGVVLVDHDNDSTDNVIGQFSAGGAHFFETMGSTWTPLDFQDAEDEPTVYDITGNDWSGSPLDPSSWLSFIAAPHYIPATSLVSEASFPGAATGNGIIYQSASGYLFLGELGNFGGPGHPAGTGWRRDGAGRLRCAIPSSASVGGTFPATAHAELWVGLSDLPSGVATDPRNYTHTLLGLEDFIMEATFDCDTSAGEVNTMYGFTAYGGSAFPPGGQASILRNGYGVVLRLTGGALSADLLVIETTNIVGASFTNGAVYSFAGPTTLDASYTAGDMWRVKIERRRYRIRAKVWEDGTAEPGAWTFDAYMPFRWDESGGAGVGFIDYPYDTNWAGDTAHDIVFAPVWDNFQMSLPSIMCFPQTTGAPQQIVYLDECYIDIDPEGATPIDALVSEQNYDGTSPSNDETVPYATIPAARFIEGSLRKRHFSADTLGFNVLAWKDGSAGPELQATMVPILYELGNLGGIISLSHLRVANRYGDHVTVRG